MNPANMHVFLAVQRTYLQDVFTRETLLFSVCMLIGVLLKHGKDSLYSKCMWAASVEPMLGQNDDIDEIWLWGLFTLRLITK